MRAEECHQLHRQLEPRWHLNDSVDSLFCSLGVTNTPSDTLRLFREFGEVSERENHHPELRWSGGRLDVEIWTHKIGALVESDFILAAKMDQILLEQNITTTFFNQLCYQKLPEHSSKADEEWRIEPEKNLLVRQFSFENFRIPWQFVLQLLEEKDVDALHFEIALGFGHLEIRMDGSCERTLINRIDVLTS